MILRDALAMVLSSPAYPGDLVDMKVDGDLETATLTFNSANEFITVRVVADGCNVDIRVDRMGPDCDKGAP